MRGEANEIFFFFFFHILGHPLFFRLVSNAFPDIGSVGRIEKENLKKITRSLQNRRRW